MNVNEQLFNSDIKRAAMLEKLLNREVKKLSKILSGKTNKARTAIDGVNKFLDNVRKRVDSVGDLPNVSARSKQAIKSSNKDIQRFVNDNLNQTVKDIRKFASDTAKKQVIDVQKDIEKRTGKKLKSPDKRTLNTPDDKGLLGVKDNKVVKKGSFDYREQSVKFKRSVRKTLRQASKKAIQQDSKAPLNAARRKVKQQTEAFTRTTTKALESEAKQKLFEVNGIDKYMWQAVLDSRTSDICRTLNGNTYTTGDGPLPPAHFNCRSSITPLIAGEGKVDNFSTWQEFLDNLKTTTSGQRELTEILGKRKAELFIEGNLPKSDVMPKNL